MSDLIKTDEELEALKSEMPDEEAEIESNFELEIVDAMNYGNTKSEALIAAEAKLATLEAQQRNIDTSRIQGESLQATMASVKALQEQLSKGINVNPVKETVPGFDFESLKKKFNEEIYTNPAESVAKFIEPFLVNLNQKIEEVNGTASKATAKSELLLNDDTRKFYTKYRDEIEDKASKLSGKDSYEKAIAEVKFLHMDDIIAEKVAEQLTKKPGQPQMTNIGVMSAPAMTKEQVTPGMRQFMDYLVTDKLTSPEYALKRAKEEKAKGTIRN